MRHALLYLLLLVSVSPQAAAEIISIVVNSDTVTITGKIQFPSPQRPGLAEVRPYEADLEGIVMKNNFGHLERVLDRYTESGYDRINSAWQLNGGPSIYATDISKAAAYPNLKPMVAKNRKGVGGIHPAPELFPDLVELGLGHITVNILVRQEFSKAQIQQLDRTLTFAHKHGIVVTAILLVPPNAPVIAHPDCDPSAHYALPNMNSQAGSEAFTKSVRFLAERYCKPDSPHGRISHWIVGNEIDAGWVWTNAGEKTAEEYMDEYHRALRVVYYTVRSFDPHGKVFISLTHHWNNKHKPNPKRYYKPRELLKLLRDHGKRSGDFEWGLAYHPYPDNLFNPKTWEDKLAKDNFDTILITMKNIEVLDRFMRQPGFLYQGKTARTILLSEQGYHTKKNDPEADNLQAAAIAYAWKKLKPIKSIEAFHYHRWIDHEREGGLNLGLWTVKKGSTTWPEKKKKSWHVYKALGTPAEAEATEFAAKYWQRAQD